VQAPRGPALHRADLPSCRAMLSVSLPNPILLLLLGKVGSLLRRRRGKGRGPRPELVSREDDSEESLQSITAGSLHAGPFVSNSRR